MQKPRGLKQETTEGMTTAMKGCNQESASEQNAGWLLSAVVGPGSLKNAGYHFTLAGWTADDQSLSMIFRRGFQDDFEDEDIYAAVEDLETILSALFLNDYLPRQVYHFWYPSSLGKEIRLKLLFMLGQPGSSEAPDQAVMTRSFSHSGLIFSPRQNVIGDDLPGEETICQWFELLRNHDFLASSVGLLKEAFLTVNLLYGQ